MRRTIMVLMFIAGFGGYLSGADYASSRGGDWNDPATWNDIGVPRSGDNLVIEEGHKITVAKGAAPINISFKEGTIKKGGILEIDYSSNGNKQVNIAIDAGGGLSVDGGVFVNRGNPDGEKNPGALNRIYTDMPKPGKNAYILLSQSAKGKFYCVSFESLGKDAPQKYGVSAYYCGESVNVPALEMDYCTISKGYYGLGLFMSNDIRVRNCLFQDCTYNIFLHDVSRMEISDCTLKNATAHIFASGSQLGLSDSTVKNCVFEKAAAYAIFVAHDLSDSAFSDAKFLNNAIDIYLASKSIMELRNSDFKNCVVDDPANGGVISESHGGKDSDVIYIIGTYYIPKGGPVVWGGGQPFWKGGKPHSSVNVKFSPIGSSLVVPDGASLSVTGTPEKRSRMDIEKGNRTWTFSKTGSLKLNYTDITNFILNPATRIEAENSTIAESKPADDEEE
ncbi:MAG: right-handed parallel beta-helix repeat-containing protein [Candidatus Omnitrophota bacterium]